MSKYLVIDMSKVKDLTFRKLWSWNDLSKQANISNATIYALQAKRRNASVRTVYKIARALDVDPKEIVINEM